MINSNMRMYDYYLFSEKNEFGQRTLIKGEDGKPLVQGQVKLSITDTSKAVQDNIKYLNSSYIALTRDKQINDSYVIQYGNERLKVLYVTPTRFKQVFLATYE